MSDSLDSLTRQAIAEKCALDLLKPWVRALDDAHREVTRVKLLAALGGKGRTWTAVDEAGEALGTVNVPRTKPSAEVADEGVFLDWARSQRPSDVREVFELRDGVTWQDVAERLTEADPDAAAALLGRASEVPAHTTAEVLRDVAAGAVVPGVVLVEKAMRVDVKPSSEARAIVAAQLGAALPSMPELGGAE